MIRITDENAYEVLTPEIAPAAYCESGERVIFVTRDCYNNVVTDERFPLGNGGVELENPVSGPLFVRGAEAGDILKVEICDIRLRSWAAMRSSIDYGVFAGIYEQKEACIFSLKDGQLIFDEGLQVSLDPMIGVIGTAPEGNGVVATIPGSHGGNMDCRKIKKGSTLYLPVNTQGALLYMGDLHGLMGDGEVFICGLETAGEVEVKVSVIKNHWLPTPFLVENGKVMTIQSAETLNAAGEQGAKLMLEFVMAATGYDAFHAGMLMSLAADVAVCQMVNLLMTARVEFPLAILEQRGYQLP